MKKRKLFVYAFAAMLMAGFATSCSDDDDDNNNGPQVGAVDTDGKPMTDQLLFNEKGEQDANGTVIGNGDKELVFKGRQTLKKGVYTLKGWIYVANGSELTIPAGTIIKGDKATQAALIVEPGGKLFAEGTKDAPIVFTSAQPKGQRKPGDWGGVILCGNAKNNQGTMQVEGGPRTKHGGQNDDDNSGVLRYVRIEFAGYPFQKDKEINGLTLGSVGRGTKIDHIQVSFSNDDSYEWFGGTVNCDHMIAYNGWDDDFDTDNGFSGHVQFGLVVRHPRLADTSQSNSFESDNCGDGANVDPHTSAVFSNITFVGPVGRDNFENTKEYINGGEYDPKNGSSLGKFQSAMQIRRSSHLACFNSVAMGYPIGLILDGAKGTTVEDAKAGKIKLQNLYFAGMTALGTDADKKYEDEGNFEGHSYSHDFFVKQPGNKAFDEIADLKFNDSFKVGVDCVPAVDSPVMNAAAWTDALVKDGFEKTEYIGAFGTENWLEGWTNFDPNNAEY